MSLYQPLATLVNNDAIFYVDVTLNGKPLDLTPFTPTVVLKATAATPDGSGTLYGIGTGLIYLDETLGKMRLEIPRSALATAGTAWWRLDLADMSGNVFTALYGPVTIKAA